MVAIRTLTTSTTATTTTTAFIARGYARRTRGSRLCRKKEDQVGHVRANHGAALEATDLMAAAAILLWVLAANGVLSRVDGLILVIGAIAYTVAVIGPRDARGAKL